MVGPSCYEFAFAFLRRGGRFPPAVVLAMLLGFRGARLERGDSVSLLLDRLGLDAFVFFVLFFRPDSFELGFPEVRAVLRLPGFLRAR